METLFSVSSSFVLMLKDREVFGFADCQYSRALNALIMLVQGCSTLDYVY
jgi:hypothetical protein